MLQAAPLLPFTLVSCASLNQILPSWTILKFSLARVYATGVRYATLDVSGTRKQLIPRVFGLISMVKSS